MEIICSFQKVLWKKCFHINLYHTWLLHKICYFVVTKNNLVEFIPACICKIYILCTKNYIYKNCFYFRNINSLYLNLKGMDSHWFIPLSVHSINWVIAPK